MKERASKSFWEAYAALPRGIQELAKDKHAMWVKDPFHGALQFKEIANGMWSVRINSQYRALAYREDELVVWFWIGTHAEYDRKIGG